MLIAFADCELRDGWLLAQDVNAWTSLAYLAVGVVVVVGALRRVLPPAFLALGALAGIEGIGSVWFHGGTGDAGQYLHDVALVGLLGFMAGWHVGRIAGGTRSGATGRAALVGGAGGLVIGSAAWAAGTWATNAAVAGLVGVLVVAEVMARARHRTPVWNGPLLGLVALAAVAWLAGTPASPVCDEESWIQFHGLWHLLSAVTILAWVSRTAAADAPERAPRPIRRAADRGLGLLGIALVHAFHRSVDVVGRERLPVGRPVLVVANHGNGFVDPIVVTAVLGRLPRFLAKAALWRVLVARPFLALAGVLPLHRRADGDRPGDNAAVFEACHHELARGGTVVIFPEGTTGDRAALDRVRTGAARIALGAVEEAPGLVVVPVGLAFESTVQTRTRAVVIFGEPIDVDPPGRHDDGLEPEPSEVRALTAGIAAALGAVSPEFASVDEREVLRAAARTALDADRPRREARFGEIEVLARRLAASPPEARAEVTEAFRGYAMRLQLAGLTDRQLGRASASPLRLALSVSVLVAFGAVVVTATLVHLPALLLVVAATGAVHSTATKGTVRLLVGLGAGLVTWIVAGVVLADGVGAVAAGVLVAVEGAVALAVWPPLTRAAATWWGRVQTRRRAGLLTPVLSDRAALVAAVHAATDRAPDASGR